MKSSGIGTKLTNDSTGSTNIFVGLEKLAEDLKFKLLTPLGSISGNPFYGSRVREMLFNPTTTATADLAASELLTLLENHPGVIVNSVKGTLAKDGKSIMLNYDINYNANEINDIITLTREGDLWQ